MERIFTDALHTRDSRALKPSRHNDQSRHDAWRAARLEFYGRQQERVNATNSKGEDGSEAWLSSWMARLIGLHWA